jgi:hypothetical protein
MVFFSHVYIIVHEYLYLQAKTQKIFKLFLKINSTCFFCMIIFCTCDLHLELIFLNLMNILK